MSSDPEEIWNRSSRESRKRAIKDWFPRQSDAFYEILASTGWRNLPGYVRRVVYRAASVREQRRHDPRRKVYVTGDMRGYPALRHALSQRYKLVRSVVGSGRRLTRQFGSRRSLDPRVLRFGTGDTTAYGKPHGYLGRPVLDLGDRHAHGIVDIPWSSLRTSFNNLKARFDPWRKALKGSRARLLAIRNPHPTDSGDRAIIEAAVHVPWAAYRKLRQSGEFDVLSDGVLARRGRKKKATNIFVMPP